MQLSSPLPCEFHISCLILGAMVFGMAFFWLLNHTNAEIQSYAWHVVSTSTVLFLAVLIGHSWEDFVGLLLPLTARGDPWWTIAVSAASLLFWQLVMQLQLARVCGIFGAEPTNRFTTVLGLKCWAILLGLICAITSTQLWGYVQSQVPKTVLANALIICTAAACMTALFRLTEVVRRKLLERRRVPAGRQTDEFVLMWKKHASDQEDIAITITVAKLAVLALQTWLSGFLPLTEEDDGGANRFVFSDTTPLAALVLVTNSVILGCLIPLINALVPDRVGRAKGWVAKCCGMGMAYSFLHGLEALLDSLTGTGPFGGVACASFITLLTFAVIFLVDFVVDGSHAESEGDLFLVQPLSILVAFSWAGAFARALRVVTMVIDFASDDMETIVLSLAFTILVVPSWRQHVLPNTMRSEIKEIMAQTCSKVQDIPRMPRTSSLQRLHNLFNGRPDAKRPLLRAEGGTPSASESQLALDGQSSPALELARERIAALEALNESLQRRLHEMELAAGKQATAAVARNGRQHA